MSENKHYEWATAAFSAVAMNSAPEFQAECRDDAKIQATLALAYEQRTANLIALYSDGSNGPAPQVEYGALMVQITKRLGL